MTERELQKNCNKILSDLNIEFIHIDFINSKKTCPKRFKGYPDLIIFLKNAKTLFVELKTDIGKLRQEQVQKKEILEKLNFDYYLVRNTNELISILKRYI